MNTSARILTAVLAITFLASCTPKAKDIEIGPYTVSVIEKDVYHIQDYNSSNPAGELFDAEGKMTHSNNCSDMYLIVGEEEALLIDLSNNIRWADNAAESLRQIVSERTEGKELIITFTHNHGDHTGMLHAYVDDPDVRFALPEKDFARLAGRFPESQCILYNEGYVFDLGDVEIETIEVPGHTNGSMVFFMEEHDLLFTGDAIGSGRGVWIFNSEGFRKYADAIPHLISWLNNPDNDVNLKKLRIYGGHYWQRDRLPELGDKELGMQYLLDMQELIRHIKTGCATSEPSGLDRRGLDTHFRHGLATITWSEEEAIQYAAQN